MAAKKTKGRREVRGAFLPRRVKPIEPIVVVFNERGPARPAAELLTQQRYQDMKRGLSTSALLALNTIENIHATRAAVLWSVALLAEAGVDDAVAREAITMQLLSVGVYGKTPNEKLAIARLTANKIFKEVLSELSSQPLPPVDQSLATPPQGASPLLMSGMVSEEEFAELFSSDGIKISPPKPKKKPIKEELLEPKNPGLPDINDTEPLPPKKTSVLVSTKKGPFFKGDDVGDVTNMVWTTADGRQVRVREMTSAHLCNAIRHSAPHHPVREGMRRAFEKEATKRYVRYESAKAKGELAIVHASAECYIEEVGGGKLLASCVSGKYGCATAASLRLQEEK